MAAFAYVDDRGKRRRLSCSPSLPRAALCHPAGLVLYWTTNNLFSYLRNVIVRRLLPRLPTRLKRPLAAIAQQQ